ncbi:hypothetical protein GCM10010466_33640 [Planomonospora alba]|uniref:Carrier domain-containing protein n=1 Tax=Planomonospora alba TaxID=161354 RepID=A0ABP6N8G0_9ACTN
MSTETDFRRPISATELMCFSMRDLAPPYAIQYVVEGIGAISAAALRDAVSVASACSPGSRLTRSGKDWVDSGVPPSVEVVTGRSLDYSHPHGDPVLTGAIGAAGDGPEPTVEVVLLPGYPVTVVFRAFHGVMDGRGLAMWVTDVFRALRGEEPLGAPDPTADHDLVARLGAKGSPTPLAPRFSSALGHGAPVRGEPAYLTRLRTVRAAPPAAVARIAAVLARHSATPSRFMIPIDLRRHDPGLRSTANLSLPLFLDATPGQRWWEINDQLLTGLLERRELNEMASAGLAEAPAVLSRTIQRGMRRLGAHFGRNVVSGLISHIGRVDLGELSGPEFTATSFRIIPVHTMMIPLGFMLVETDSVLELAVSVRNGRGIPERLDRLLDEIVAELEGAVPDAGDGAGRRSPAGSPAEAPGATAVTLFRDRVAAAPDAIAVRGPEGELTYRELAARADAVAAELLGLGVRPGDVVAVLAGRTPGGVVAQWAALLAGAAFLPLDPSHPVERIRETLRRSGTRHCLVERRHLEIVGDTAEPIVLEEFAEAAAEPVPVAVDPSDTAYVVYTSGSTGLPKGVRVTHAGVANWYASAKEWYRLGPGTKYCHYHTPAADLACIAFFAAHLSGGSLVLVPDELDPVTIRGMLTTSGADTVLLTPSLAEVIVSLGFEPAPIRTLIFAGEQLNAPLAAEARRFFGPDTLMVNSYGPAEVTLTCTNHTLGPEIDPAGGPVPIGRPSAGTPVFLLDADRNPVAPGEIGELYFGGPQVARDYLGQPDLTAERFVVLDGGERAYRTGDLAHALPDGTLVFHGRVDDQVKIRGYRIEPNEVRLAIERHPAVRQAAVVAHRRNGSDHALAAFVVSDTTIDPAVLRAHLAERLPSYMIPATVHQLPALPLNGNGKLDRSRLPVPLGPGPDPEPPAAAESVPARIQRIWADILGVRLTALHPDSEFFAHGGDSLSAVRMLSAVARILPVESESDFITAVRRSTGPLTLARVCEAAHRAVA